jgi:8-oxo-dGTP pyrophosphatase MutT (NUDIX family)
MLYTEKPEIFSDPTEIVGCFVECQGKILMLHRQGHKEHGGDYGPPGGKLDKSDKDLASGIAREIFEETGLQCSSEKINFITTFFVKYTHNNRDFLYHQFRIIFDEFPEIKVNPSEHQGYKWVTPDEALTMPLIHDEDKCIEYVYKR